MDTLREHSIFLNLNKVKMRPLTENDWYLLNKWNNDQEVLYYSEGGSIEQYSMEDLQHMYRYISQNAYCFIIEYDNEAIGECWIQKLNLPRLIEKFPNLECRRIDMMIGEKNYWGKGIGTQVLTLLYKYGFKQENADIIFGCDIADYNLRSLNVFKKIGFEVFQLVNQKEGQKAKVCYDMILKKKNYRVVQILD